MRVLQFAVGALCFGAVTGCLSGRDNPRDPANAPVAKLRVVDGSGAEQIGAVSRGLELVLDGSDSSDPQGSYDCEFSVTEPEGEPRDIPSTSDCRAELGDLRRQLVIGSNLTFQLVVQDGSGGRDEAEATIRLLNARPTADAGPPRTLPQGGFPWSPLDDFQVPFFANGFDADAADILEYCWTFAFAPAGEVCSLAPDDPAFVRTIPRNENKIYAATLRVDDNDDSFEEPRRLVSYASTTRVHVGPPTLWSATDEEGAVERIDIDRQTLVPTDADPTRFVSAALTATHLVYAWDALADPNQRSNSLTSIPSDVPLTNAGTTRYLGDGEIAVAVDPKQNRLWLHLGNDSPNGIPCTCSDANACSVVAVLDAATLANVGCSVLDRPLFANGILVIDSAGGAFVPEDLSSRVAWVDPTGTSLTADIFPGTETILGLGVRPGTNETWAVVIASTGDNPAHLVVLRPGTGGIPAEIGRIALGVNVAFGVGWIGSDELWLHVSDSGFHRLDARVLESFLGDGDPPLEPALESATIEILEGVYDVTDMIVDSFSGEVWATGHATGDLYRASPGGAIDTFDIEADALVVDAEGRLIFTTPGKLHRGSSPSADGVIASLGLFVASAPEPDLEAGGIWAPLLLPPALARVAEDGSFQRFLTSVELDGTTRPVPILREFRLAPGGDVAFGISAFLPNFSPGPIFRFDLDVDPVVATTVFGSAASIALVSSGSILEVSAPVGTQEPFLWAVTGADGPAAVRRYDFAGTALPGAFLLPTNETGSLATTIRAARSLATNHLCLATVQTIVQDLLMIRRIDPDMVVTLLDIAPDTLPPGFELVALAATPDPDPASGSSGDVCWVAFRHSSGSTIMGFQTAGAVPSWIYNGPAGLTSMAPLSVNEIWITQEQTPGGAIEKILLVGPSPFSVAPGRILTPSSPNGFRMLESRGTPFAPPGAG